MNQQELEALLRQFGIVEMRTEYPETDLWQEGDPIITFPLKEATTRLQYSFAAQQERLIKDIESKLPEKKLDVEYKEIEELYPTLPKTLPDVYEAGYNKALDQVRVILEKQREITE